MAVVSGFQVIGCAPGACPSELFGMNERTVGAGVGGGQCFALVRTDLEELLAPVPQIMERIRERSEALFKLFEESPAYLAFCKRMNLSNGKEQVCTETAPLFFARTLVRHSPQIV